MTYSVRCIRLMLLSVVVLVFVRRLRCCAPCCGSVWTVIPSCLCEAMKTERLDPGVGVVVHDFGVDLEAYASFGTNPPVHKPSQCRRCDAKGSLQGHGVRRRGVWLPDRRDALLKFGTGVLVIYVRRLRCKVCGGTCTVLPSGLHAYRRYALEEIQKPVVAHWWEGVPLRDIEARCALGSHPAPGTQTGWVREFGAQASVWLERVSSWLARGTPSMVLPTDAAQGGGRGLLAMAPQCVDWIRETCNWEHLPEHRVLEGLWLWGTGHVKTVLVAPTRPRAVSWLWLRHLLQPYRMP